MIRPRNRWPHSHQKITLNSSSVIALLTSRNSGVSWYLAKAVAQSAAPIGGRVPITRFHSVIERPLSVSRVRPPTMIITTTSAKSTISQVRIGLRAPPAPPLSIMPVCTALRPADASSLTSSKMLRWPAMALPCLSWGDT